MIHTMDSLFIPGGFRPFPDDDDVYYYNGERLKLEGETEKRGVSCCSLRGNPSRSSRHASIFSNRRSSRVETANQSGAGAMSEWARAGNRAELQRA